MKRGTKAAGGKRDKIDPRIVLEMVVAYLGETARPELAEMLSIAWSELDRRARQRRQQAKGADAARKARAVSRKNNDAREGPEVRRLRRAGHTNSRTAAMRGMSRRRAKRLAGE